VHDELFSCRKWHGLSRLNKRQLEKATGRRREAKGVRESYREPFSLRRAKKKERPTGYDGRQRYAQNNPPSDKSGEEEERRLFGGGEGGKVS